MLCHARFADRQENEAGDESEEEQSACKQTGDHAKTGRAGNRPRRFAKETVQRASPTDSYIDVDGLDEDIDDDGDGGANENGPRKCVWGECIHPEFKDAQELVNVS